MNWDSWLEPKNSLIAATTGRALIREAAVAHALDDLLLGPAQAFVDLVAADPAEVEAAGVEEEALEQVAGVVHGCGVTRPDALVELDQGIVGRHRRVLIEGRVDVPVL